MNGGVSLSWTAATGSAPLTYTISRATVSGGSYTTLDLGSVLTIYNDVTAANGTTYYYKVTAVNAGGSTDSNEISGTPIATFNMTSVALAGGGGVSLVWPAVSGASSYKVKYGIASGGPYGTLVTSSASSP